SLADFNSFNGVHTHDGLRQPAVQACVPTGMRTQSKWNPAGNNLKCAADCISVFLRLFDLANHLVPDIGYNTTYNVIVANRFQLVPGNGEIVRQFQIAD